ncbi:MAG: DUF3667 domain-containing protein [Pseudomonadales bacterium]
MNEVPVMVPSDSAPTDAPGTIERCRNCDAALNGEYCAGCGQAAQLPALTLWALGKELSGELFNWDSRLWRTLRPLAFQPGFLTLEYRNGRRARYMPPLRMYLVLSLLFFLTVSVENSSGLTEAIDAEALSISAPSEPEAVAGRDGTITATDCDGLEMGVEGLSPAWEQRIRESCHRVLSDPVGFGSESGSFIPCTLFVFLPLLAGLTQLLYFRSGHYFVEHLLFFVHVHAFFFLGSLLIAVLEIFALLPLGQAISTAVESVSGLAFTALVLYSPYYLYRAMRNVYRQKRLITWLKVVCLGVGYLLFLSITSAALLLYTALRL